MGVSKYEEKNNCRGSFYLLYKTLILLTMFNMTYTKTLTVSAYSSHYVTTLDRCSIIIYYYYYNIIQLNSSDIVSTSTEE